MSDAENDRFLEIACAQLASEESIRGAFTLAEDLVASAEIEYVQAVTVYDPESDAEVVFDLTYLQRPEQHDNEPLPTPYVSIVLSRGMQEGYACQLVFDTQGERRLAIYHDDETAVPEAVGIAADLLASRRLSYDQQQVIKFLISLLDGPDTSPAYTPDPTDVPGKAVGTVQDVVRDFVRETQGDRCIARGRVATWLDGNGLLSISQFETLGYTDPYHEDIEDVPALHIELQSVNDMTYSMQLLRDGRIVMDTDLSDYTEVTAPLLPTDYEDGDYVPEDDVSETVNRPMQADVDLVLDALIALEMSTVGDVIPGDGFVYPTLPFGVDPPFDEHGRVVSVEGVARQALQALDRTQERILPELCGADAPRQQPVRYNTNKIRRAENFLGTTVRRQFATRSSHARRRDVVDMQQIYAEVLDELTVTNHPVLQLVEVLYEELENHVDGSTLEQIIGQILHCTHWETVRAKVSRDVTTWRHTVPSDTSY